MLEARDVPAFKIGSGEATNTPLLEHIARKGRPMIVSSGMTTFDELARSLEVIRPINPNLVVLHCTSTYPTRFADVRLGAIARLRERFDVPVGLSDHSPGIATAVASVALGACLIEKHFTLDRSWPGPDQAGSIEPDELRRLAVEAGQVYEALGDKPNDKHGVIDDEREVQQMARESLVTIAPIAAGQELTEDNLWVKRPGSGIPAWNYREFLGRRVARDLPGDHLLQRDDVR